MGLKLRSLAIVASVALPTINLAPGLVARNVPPSPSIDPLRLVPPLPLGLNCPSLLPWSISTHSPPLRKTFYAAPLACPSLIFQIVTSFSSRTLFKRISSGDLVNNSSLLSIASIPISRDAATFLLFPPPPKTPSSKNPPSKNPPVLRLPRLARLPVPTP